MSDTEQTQVVNRYYEFELFGYIIDMSISYEKRLCTNSL